MLLFHDISVKMLYQFAFLGFRGCEYNCQVAGCSKEIGHEESKCYKTPYLQAGYTLKLL